jgi:uncharacterized OB-fold protein
VPFDEVSGRGTVYSFCETHRTAIGAFTDDVPYLVALVELPEQSDLRLLTNIVDAEASEVFVGSPVEVCFERRGEVAIPQFRLVATSERQ